jgi:hypothetical protein
MCSGFSPRLAFRFELFLDPVLEIADRIRADAELDEMKRHAEITESFAGFDHHDLARLPQLARRRATGTFVTIPANGARSVCSIFIASMTARRWPAAT